MLHASAVLARVAQGTSLTEVLQQQMPQHWPAATRGAIQDISYTTLRQYGLVKALVAVLVERPPQPQLHALLATALTLLVEQRYTAHTLVDQAVQAAAADRKLAGARHLVNAVLRRFLREQEALLSQVRQQPAAQWNYPAWWITEVQKHYPLQWPQILIAGNQPPPLTLRVNRRWGSPVDYVQQLQAHDLRGHVIGPAAVCLERPVPVTQLPGFAAGWVSVQDAGAQLAAPLLDLQDGMRVLDACAAPGGKTAHLLELAAIELLALDQDAKRLNRVEENLQRLQLQATVRAGDAGQPSTWWDGRPFDRILADVPCSAAGIVRRHPDIRWLRRPQDLLSLPQQQLEILNALWSLLAPNGKLLYATCSIFPQEGEAVIAQFLQQHPSGQSVKRLSAPGQLLPIPSAIQDTAEIAAETARHDGFFYALLQKV